MDVSASMRGGPIEATKTALIEALSKLDPLDSFNIIAFNDTTELFSSSMVLATNEAIETASEWIKNNLIAEGGTNIYLPLNQVSSIYTYTKITQQLIMRLGCLKRSDVKSFGSFFLSFLFCLTG